MTKISFELIRYSKYNTKKVLIAFADLKLDEDCEVLETQNTEYNYKKVVLKLPYKKANKVKEYQEIVNNYLEKHDLPKNNHSLR